MILKKNQKTKNRFKIYLILIIILFLIINIKIISSEYTEVNLNSEINLENKNSENYLEINENFIEVLTNEKIQEFIYYNEDVIKINISNKEIEINITNLVNYELSEKYKIKKINLTLEKESYNKETNNQNYNPKIVFYNYEKILFSIEQIEKGLTKIYLGTPDIKRINENENIVYIVEHYEPDLIITHPDRKQGKKKLSINTINNPKVKINNSGLVLISDKLKIHKSSLENTENFDDKEINSIEKNKIFNIFNYLKTLVIKISDSFEINKNYDRGYKISESKEIQEYLEISENYIDVTPENCNKFIEADEKEKFINEIFQVELNKIDINSNLIIIEIKQNLKKDDNLEKYYEALDYVIKKIQEIELKEIKNNKNINKEENNENNKKIKKKIIIKINNYSDDILDILNYLKIRIDNQNLDNENIYFILLDKPNIETENKTSLNAKEYANLLLEAINLNIKLILTDLEQGKDYTDDNKKRYNSKNYYIEIFENQEILDNIDYILFSIDKNITKKIDIKDIGKNFCKNITNLNFYKQDINCLDSIYGYRFLLDTAKDYINEENTKDNNKEIKAIIIIENNEIEKELDYIENLKIDPYVENVLLKHKIC